MVEPGERDPIFDSGPEIVCEGGCHFSGVPLEKSCLFGVFFCLFSHPHHKFWVEFGAFWYFLRGDNSDQVAIDPELQNRQAAPLQP